MKNVINLADSFPSVQLSHDKGMGYKIILLRIYLDSLTDDDIVMFTDAHDIFVTGSHNEILARYWNFGSEIVFAAERNCWPLKSLETQYLTYNDVYIKYKYLNSGGFIGKVGSLKQFIDQNFHNVSGSTDDQLWYSQLYIRNQTNRTLIQLDTRCEIFQCLHQAVFDIDQNTLKNKVTNTTPLVWHSNGALVEFFMTRLCGLEYIPPVKLEIDQQLISPSKNIICITTQTNVPVEFFKTYILGQNEPVSHAQDIIHKEYPRHWIFILGKDVQLPEQFEYRVYGRVLDTRKMYVLIKQDQTLDNCQLYYDKSKKYNPDEWSMIDPFIRSNLLECL